MFGSGHAPSTRTPDSTRTTSTLQIKNEMEQVPTPPPDAESMTPDERLAYLQSRGVDVKAKQGPSPVARPGRRPGLLHKQTSTPGSVLPPAPTLDDDEDGLTMDQRMAYLRARGVEVETAEDRLQEKVVVPLRGAGEFVYLKLPHAPAEVVQRLHGPISKGDSLLTLLKAVFADTTVMDQRAVERETTQRLGNMMSQQSLEAPSFDTLQSLASEDGHVEAYPLARDASNGRHVSLYIDGIGALRERPRNVRAEKLCAACGLHGLAIRGDAYVARTQSNPDGLRNVDFYESELDPSSDWCVASLRKHHEQSQAMRPVETKSGLGENYAWSQTDDEVEVVVTCPVADKPLKHRVAISYGRGDALTVTCDGIQLVHWAPLFDKIDPTGCSWTVDGATLVVTLEKREEREWHTLWLARRA